MPRLVRELVGADERPIRRAILGGAAAGSVGTAFLAGYQAALRALVPGLGESLTALCATERGGGHPRAIEARLEPDGAGWRLSGRKTFVTGGRDARVLLVVAHSGLEPDGRKRLHLVRVAADAPGVSLTPLPALPFAPDVSHAAVELERVAVGAEALLPGDGYTRYLKPFRTVEDLHVVGALLGYLLACGLAAGWARGLLEEAGALLASARELSGRDPSAPGTHLALAGLLASARTWIERTRPGWGRLGLVTGAALERDIALLGVADGARERRTAVAWETLGGSTLTPPPGPES